MSDPLVDASPPNPAAPPPAAPPGFVFTDAQFTSLVAALKGHSAVSVVAADAKAVGSDVIDRIKQVIADAEGAAGHVHGAAKALQADVKANWPLLLIAGMSAAGLALHFIKLFSFQIG